MGSRPLPALPDDHITGRYPHSQYRGPISYGFYPHNYPQYSQLPHASAYAAPVSDVYDSPATSSLPVGTFLHKGFYDLLSMIPTPSPSRLLWGPSRPEPEPVVAGPRYEHIHPPANAAVKAMPKKGRRVSKDMVSKPTGFVYVLIDRPAAIHLTAFHLKSPRACIRCRPVGGPPDKMGSRWNWKVGRSDSSSFLAIPWLTSVVQIHSGRSPSKIVSVRIIKRRRSTRSLTP